MPLKQTETAELYFLWILFKGEGGDSIASFQRKARQTSLRESRVTYGGFEPQPQQGWPCGTIVTLHRRDSGSNPTRTDMWIELSVPA